MNPAQNGQRAYGHYTHSRAGQQGCEKPSDIPAVSLPPLAILLMKQNRCPECHCDDDRYPDRHEWWNTPLLPNAFTSTVTT